MQLCAPYNERDKVALRNAVEGGKRKDSSSSSKSSDPFGLQIAELPSLRRALEDDFVLEPLLLWRGGGGRGAQATPTPTSRRSSNASSTSNANKFQAKKKEGKPSGYDDDDDDDDDGRGQQPTSAAIDFSLYDVEVAGRAPEAEEDSNNNNSKKKATQQGSSSIGAGGLYLRHDMESQEYRDAFVKAARSEYARIFSRQFDKNNGRSISSGDGDRDPCCFVRLSVLGGEQGQRLLRWLESAECGLRVNSDSKSYNVSEKILCAYRKKRENDDRGSTSIGGRDNNSSHCDDEQDDDAEEEEDIELVRGVICTASSSFLSELRRRERSARKHGRSESQRASGDSDERDRSHGSEDSDGTTSRHRRSDKRLATQRHDDYSSSRSAKYNARKQVQERGNRRSTRRSGDSDDNDDDDAGTSSDGEQRSFPAPPAHHHTTANGKHHEDRHGSGSSSKKKKSDHTSSAAGHTPSVVAGFDPMQSLLLSMETMNNPSKLLAHTAPTTATTTDHHKKQGQHNKSSSSHHHHTHDHTHHRHKGKRHSGKDEQEEDDASEVEGAVGADEGAVPHESPAAQALYHTVTGNSNQSLLPTGFSKRFTVEMGGWFVMDHVNRRGYDVTHAACVPNVVLQHTLGIEEEIVSLRARLGP